MGKLLWNIARSANCRHKYHTNGYFPIENYYFSGWRSGRALHSNPRKIRRVCCPLFSFVAFVFGSIFSWCASVCCVNVVIGCVWRILALWVWVLFRTCTFFTRKRMHTAWRIHSIWLDPSFAIIFCSSLDGRVGITQPIKNGQWCWSWWLFACHLLSISPLPSFWVRRGLINHTLVPHNAASQVIRLDGEQQSREMDAGKTEMAELFMV